MKDQIQEAEETKRGQEIVRLLGLKEAKQEDGKHFNPPRYSTTHGTKTALGLYRTLEAFFNKEGAQ